MSSLRLQRVDQRVRRALPMTLILALVVLGVLPLRLPHYGALMSGFVLIAIYFWTLHRPELLRPWGVFVAGLLSDLLSGGPLGLNAAVLVLVHAVLEPQRKVLRATSFELIWGGFAIMAVGAELLKATIGHLVVAAPFYLSLFLIQLGATILLYPAVAWGFGRLQRAVLPEE